MARTWWRGSDEGKTMAGMTKERAVMVGEDYKDLADSSAAEDANSGGEI